jgi:ubiquinone/menaquinone biosynthesis C-methylase UbiE
MHDNTIEHYDLLIKEGNDPVLDSQPLQKYMDKWDGQVFIDELNLTSDKTVLEIGVGTGRLALRVAPLCKYFTGIDFSPKTVERAINNLSANKNVSIVCADFMKYKFDAKFDVIYSSLTFMHIKEKQSTITEISRILKPNGRLVLSIDKSQDEYIDMEIRKIKIFPDNPKHICDYVQNAKMIVDKIIETEFAFIVVATA